MAVGDYCADFGMADGALDGTQLGLGWNDDGIWYLYYDGSWDFIGAYYPEYLFYSTVYGEDGGYFVTPQYGAYYADYLVYYYY